MSSLPLLLHLIDELDREQPFYGNDFGLGISPYQRLARCPFQNMVAYNSPLPLLSRYGGLPLEKRGEKKENWISGVGKDGFQVCIDVAMFKPNELNVKVVDNNSVVIEGKHEEREDQHGSVERHFVRRYVLPQGYDANKVVSTLSSDGVLTVSVPKPQIENKPDERIIQIQQTGPAHLNVKENSQEKIGDASNGTSGGNEQK